MKHLSAFRQLSTALALGLVLSASAALAASSNADLEILQVRSTDQATLTPAFAPERTSYDVQVGSDITAVQVRTGAWVSASKVTVNGAAVPYLGWYRGPLQTGANDFRIDVAATDGKANKVYTVRVTRSDIKPVADAFLKATYTDPRTGLVLPYRLFVPAAREPGRRYPLVMFLHGGGENGADNEKQLYGTEGATVWAKPEEQARHPAFVFAPQARAFNGATPDAPIGGFGITRNLRAERYMDEALKPSADARMALQALEQVLREHPEIDRRRIYVTGLSQGGFGAWNVMLLRPDLFAAGVPIAGGGDPTQLARLVDMPIWAFHSEDDPVVPVGYSRRSIATLRSLGGHPRYTEFSSGTFFDPYEHFAWVRAYADPALRDWLFQQSRP